MTTRTEENRQLQIRNERRLIDYPHRDRLGRVIGSQVATWSAIMVAAERGRSSLPPGPAFGLNTMATRNRVPYGASQPDRWFATEAEREAAIAAYIVGAKKRAAAKASA